MSIGKRLLEASTLEVEGDGGVKWRVRKVMPSELYQAGAPGLFAAVPIRGGKVDEDALAERILGDSARLQAGLSMSETQISLAVIAASVDGGATWEPIKLTRDHGEVDLEANVLHVSVIAGSTLQAVQAAMVRLGGGAAQPTVPFQSRRSAPPVRGGKGVRS